MVEKKRKRYGLWERVYIPRRQCFIKNDTRSLHDLRHTFAVMRYLETRDIYQVSKELGHSSVKMTEKYTTFNTRKLEEDFPSFANNYNDIQPRRFSILPVDILPAEIGSSEQIAMILPMDTNMPQEYLIIENRQKMGSDQDLNSNSSGLMVWQVDDTMTDIYPARNVNENPDCYGVSHLGSGMTILNNPYTYSYDRDGDGDIEQGSGSNIEISNIVEDLNEVISLEVINPNLQGNVIGYDEGNYEGTAFSSEGSIEWAGIRFQSPGDVLLSGVKTVFPPSTSVSNLSYTIKIWHGWSESSNKPLELRYTYDGNVNWESKSLRDGGWVFISFIDFPKE